MARRAHVLLSLCACEEMQVTITRDTRTNSQITMSNTLMHGLLIGVRQISFDLGLDAWMDSNDESKGCRGLPTSTGV